MARDDNRGQMKSHMIFDADGNPVLNEDGTQRTMTQTEWRNRDKSLGYTRGDDEATPESPEAEPVPTES